MNTTSSTSSATAVDYDYDINEAFQSYDWSELVPAVVVYLMILLLGVGGNSLIICTIARYRRLKTVTNTFLASLASADLLLVLVCIPFNVAKLMSYSWTYGVFLCKFAHYIQNVSAVCSVLTLTAMSIERYYAIVHPIRAQYMCTVSQAKKVISFTWFLSVVLAMPTLKVQIQLPVGERVPAYWCVRDWLSPLGWQIYELYMLILVLILPTVIMAVAYCAIGREIWRVTAQRSAMINEPPINIVALAAVIDEACSSAELPDVVGAEMGVALNRATGKNGRRRGNQTRAQADHRTAKQVVKMLVAVVLLFVICWSPYLIDNVLMSFDVLPAARTGRIKHMRIAFHLLSYVNSCINPFVYGFMSRNFRRGFEVALRLRSPGHFTLCCCCCFKTNCCDNIRKKNRGPHPIYEFSQISRQRNSRASTQEPGSTLNKQP